MQILIKWSGDFSLESKDLKEVREECCRQWECPVVGAGLASF